MWQNNIDAVQIFPIEYLSLRWYALYIQYIKFLMLEAEVYWSFLELQ